MGENKKRRPGGCYDCSSFYLSCFEASERLWSTPLPIGRRIIIILLADFFSTGRVDPERLSLFFPSLFSTQVKNRQNPIRYLLGLCGCALREKKTYAQLCQFCHS